MPDLDCEYSWLHFDDAIAYITDSIEKSEWKPDVILGIWRGGAIPAIALSHKLNVPVEVYSEATMIKALRAEKKILLVDEIIDSGNTIKDILDSYTNFLYHIPQSSIRTAALVLNIDQNKALADYYYTTIRRSVWIGWITFPWENKNDEIH